MSKLWLHSICNGPRVMEQIQHHMPAHGHDVCLSVDAELTSTTGDRVPNTAYLRQRDNLSFEGRAKAAGVRISLFDGVLTAAAERHLSHDPLIAYGTLKLIAWAGAEGLPPRPCLKPDKGVLRGGESRQSASQHLEVKAALAPLYNVLCRPVRQLNARLVSSRLRTSRYAITPPRHLGSSCASCVTIAAATLDI